VANKSAIKLQFALLKAKGVSYSHIFPSLIFSLPCCFFFLWVFIPGSNSWGRFLCVLLCWVLVVLMLEFRASLIARQVLHYMNHTTRAMPPALLALVILAIRSCFLPRLAWTTVSYFLLYLGWLMCTTTPRFFQHF
jgi:hypothetical protein